MGLCNGAVVRRAGWPTRLVNAAVWVPAEQRFLEQDVAYPAREILDHPPFGNVSSQSNPMTPTGALYPYCWLMQNASIALSVVHHAQIMPPQPYLIGPGDRVPYRE